MVDWLLHVWDGIVYFWLANPEIWPAGWLLLGFVGVYLVLLIASWIAASVKKEGAPFLDSVVYLILAILFCALALVTLYYTIDLFLNQIYYVFWFHVIPYIIILIVSVLIIAALVPSLRDSD